MIGVKVRTSFDKKAVLNAARKGTFKSLAHAAAAIRQTAARSIKDGKKPSPPGNPPHTRRGRRLRNAIRYEVDERKQRAVIGPAADIAGTSGRAHEFGGRYRDEFFPQRPFMAPALITNAARLPEFWQGSIKS